MPVPETFQLYGDTTLVAPQSPNANVNPLPNQPRHVTRTATLHFTHGWRYRPGDNSANRHVHFWIDLDGSLYQNNEADNRFRHAGGAPYFNTGDLIRNTSVAVEITRFGKIEPRPGGGGWRINGPNVNFDDDPTDPEWCDYSPMSNAPGPRRFNLWKIAGGDTHEAATRPYYKIKSAEFNDNRNPESGQFLRDVLFTDEQLATCVLWLKAILENYRIPKRFLRNPATGVENPWIDTVVLARDNQPDAMLRQEAIERASSHQGVWGHMNLQGNRVDPGASMDYYRLKRGISDRWWYPVNLDGTERALNYLDAGRSVDYLALTEYGELSDLEAYYRLNEEGQTGFYPIGSNRVWHGAIHLDSGSDTKQVYAMANGWIVAARVTNGTVNGMALPYSRCFVLIKHPVHTQDNGDEIDYGANSTRIVYSLYMHLEPAVLAQRPDGAGGQRWDFDYATMPPWLCHFLIDNPTHATVNTGGIIYPNHKVDLSDYLGDTGMYITDVRNGTPVMDRTIHVEVFTTEDPNTFGSNPWTAGNNRVIDPTPDDAIADHGMLDSYVRDAAGDGIDIVDIKNAAPGMRSLAIQSRSEHTLTDKSQLGHHNVAVTDDEWTMLIRPLCFHADITADAAAPAVEIGPYHGTTTVWHFHPFTFLQWMNQRVDRHDQILADQDKARPHLQSNIVINNGYVTGFQNLGGATPTQLQQNTGAIVYPEAQYNENTYSIWLRSNVTTRALML
ncbi:hypothetical protein DSCO28_65090 [Desulfosarcina ovata subsp. sediminis]|uniref:Uncharacterized protein n=1 Tax=Desulfosarcina ovata subsp. sediminis TaxID=885957 RepID=A0A5K8A0C0_9BACT|nr:N-acetylmuramoyl-L-alanine amidase [Desulfosarcina ovata]BBO85943.1 hypothetical protein DSCO28_65090 [Desulfosarcina ovata subsp. sediminis]